MIIDLILDRKDGVEYNPHDFYIRCRQYEEDIDGVEITKAMDYGTDADVKEALCAYIIDFGYNPQIIKYVLSVPWIEDF